MKFPPRGSWASVRPFLRRLKRSGARIEAVATDMGQAFPSAVAKVFPGALLMNDKLAKLRRDMQREADVLGRDKPKGTRWLLSRNPENLDPRRNWTEGFNHKAQTMKRQAYGYGNMDLFMFMLKLRNLHVKKYARTG